MNGFGEKEKKQSQTALTNYINHVRQPTGDQN
jgi:hypothetical protein